MTCKSVLARLTALRDKELTAAQAARVWAHLAECAACAQAQAEIERTLAAADLWEADAGVVWDAVRAEIEPPVEFGAVLREMQSLRTEVQTLRAEIAALRGQLAARPAETPRSPSPLLPYAPSGDSSLRLM